MVHERWCAVLDTTQLLARARALHTEALALLDGAVLPVLREALGEVEVAGSVALDLMTWRDIDLFARLEAGEAPRLLALVPRLSAALAAAGQPVSRIAFRDEHLERDPAFPDDPGLYLGVSTGPGAGATSAGEADLGWKLDLWGWDRERYEPQRRRHAELAAMLAQADRGLILRVKHAVAGRPGYRSTDVYAFALAEAGDSLEDFDRFRAELAHRGSAP